MKGKRNIGIGYITFPSDVDPIQYKQICFKAKTVCILTEESEVYPRVKISKSLLEKVRFPNFEKGELIGSIVVYIRVRTSSIPIIISVLELADEGTSLLSGQWKMDVHTETDNISFIQGDADKGTLDIIVHSSEEFPSELVLRATSKNKNSKVKVESDFEVEVISSESVSVQSKTVKVQGELILLNGDKEGITMSSKLVERLNKVESDINDLKSLFSQWVPAPGDGGFVLKTLSEGWSIGLLSETKQSDIESDKVKTE